MVKQKYIQFTLVAAFLSSCSVCKQSNRPLIKRTIKSIEAGFEENDTTLLKYNCVKPVYDYFYSETVGFTDTEKMNFFSSRFDKKSWKMAIDEKRAKAYKGTRSGLTGYTRLFYFIKETASSKWQLSCYPITPSGEYIGECEQHGFIKKSND